MSQVAERLDKLGGIIDANTKARGVAWLSEAHESFPDTTEIMMLHNLEEDWYTVREYARRQRIPHKQARLSERRWNGTGTDDAINQRTRRVFPGIRLEIEQIGFDDFDTLWISKRVGKVLGVRIEKMINKIEVPDGR